MTISDEPFPASPSPAPRDTGRERVGRAADELFSKDGIRQAAVRHLANIRDYLERLAAEAGIADPDSFARKWHILMKGSIMAAHEGDARAAGRAREMGELLLRENGA